MSSTTDSVKQPPGQASEEPSSKKVKLSESDTNKNDTTTKTVEDKNGTATATERSVKNNNNGATCEDKGTSKNSTKPLNGTETKKGDEADQDVEGDEDAGDRFDEDDEAESGNLDGVFDPKIAKALEQVENIQLEICNLNEKASEEILKVEQKFNKLRRPHFEKRNELLKEIPNFWLTSLANHQIIAPMIESAEDEDCLHYMVNLDVEEFEDIKSGYRLKLYFLENPYITNEIVVKEFNNLSSDEAQSTSSTPIEYKNTPQGKSLKQVVENSTAQYKRSRRPGQTQQSFFAWLAEPTESRPDEVAEILKDQIWPNPLEFFFAAPEDYGAGSDDESDDEDEEIDDEDIDDDDDDNVITEGGAEFSDEELDGEDDDDDDDEDV